MQQDTNGFKLIQEILKFLAQDSKQTLPKRENQTLPKSNSNVSGNEQFSSGSHLADSSSSLKGKYLISQTKQRIREVNRMGENSSFVFTCYVKTVL